jgi:4-hydroxy-3-polyprenylbenzoate decarboxylase
MNEQKSKRIIVAVAGASGAAYARRLIECMCEAGVDVHLVVTPAGQRLLHDELGIRETTAQTLMGHDSDRLIIHPYKYIGSEIASGSFHSDGMVVCPCSSNRVASIAAGLADNLLDRAAAVTLKEMRRLVVVHREMPMSRIDLQNALRLTEAGAVFCPASPGFYMMPKTIDDIVDMVVGKVLDLFSVEHTLNIRWADQMIVPKTSSSQAKS